MVEYLPTMPEDVGSIISMLQKEGKQRKRKRLEGMSSALLSCEDTASRCFDLGIVSLHNCGKSISIVNKLPCLRHFL